MNTSHNFIFYITLEGIVKRHQKEPQNIPSNADNFKASRIPCDQAQRRPPQADYEAIILDKQSDRSDCIDIIKEPKTLRTDPNSFIGNKIKKETMSQNKEHNRCIVLAGRPHGKPVSENFRLEKTPIPEPAEGQVLLRTEYLSLDPYMRGRMSDAPSYADPVQVMG